MKTIAPSFNMDFPSKNYKKYKSQSKTNPLFNKLSQDAGYPQEVLNHSTISHNRKIKNYLEDNKKNLRNFFNDRLPPKDIDIWSQSYTIDPPKLFEIKKRQQQLKLVTRSAISQKLQQKNNKKKESLKIAQIFQFNDKNHDFKQSFMDSGLRVSQPYQCDNFLKGTQSYIQKYRQITKKQAYNSVFGCEPSAIPRKISLDGNQSAMKPRPNTYSQARRNKVYIVDSQSKQLQRKKFSSLIQKIDGHRRSFDPDNKCGFKPYVPPQQVQNKQTQKSDMITWIKDVTRQYKFQSVDADFHRMRDVQDIQKMDSQFYKQMRNHKAKRLYSRQGQVQNSIGPKSQRSSMINSARMDRRISHRSPHALELSKINSNSSISLRQQQQNSQISSSDQQIVEQRPAGEISISYFFRKLGRQLINALEQSRISGIKNAFNAYKAFWKNPQPYQKSGSYAFFKAIKKGDVEGVNKFIRLDPDYIYERDHKLRSPLIFAAANNHTKLVQIFLSLEINVNQKSMNRKSALYYAVKHQNLYLVKKLLQSGAIPWSSKNCNMIQLLKQANNPQLNTLFKNARRVSIALKLKPSVALRAAFWEDVKQLINQIEILSFD